MKNLMKSITLGIAIAAGTAYAMANDLDSLSPEELYPLALEEGSVSIYSLSSRISQVADAFEETYPGVEVNWVNMNSTKQLARLQSEHQASIYAVDVLFLSEAARLTEEVLSTGMVEKYVPPRVGSEIPDVFKEDLLYYRLSTRALLYNEVAYPDGSPVDNLWQLTTPEWSGRVLVADPTQRGEVLDLLTEIVIRSDEMAEAYEAYFDQPIEVDRDLENAGEQFIRDLFQNDLVFVTDSETLNRSVGDVNASNPPVGFVTYSSRRDNEQEGWALQIANDVNPTSGILFPVALTLANNAPNPAAARLLIDFMFGDDTPTGGPGFEPFYVSGDYATRRSIQDHPESVPYEDLNLWLIDPAKTAEVRSRVLDLVIIHQ